MLTRTRTGLAAAAIAAAVLVPAALAAGTSHAIKPVRASTKISGTVTVSYVAATHKLTLVIKAKNLKKGTYVLDITGSKSFMLSSLKVKKSGSTVSATRTAANVTTWPATGETLTIGLVATAAL